MVYHQIHGPYPRLTWEVRPVDVKIDGIRDNPEQVVTLVKPAASAWISASSPREVSFSVADSLRI